MSGYLNYNGSILEADRLIIAANNRGLRYGDGLFETMKFSSGRIQLATYHFDRLFNGIRLLGFEMPDHFTREYFVAHILELCSINQLALAKLRLMVFRGKGGLYDPEDHHPNFVIEAVELQAAVNELHADGLSLGMYTDASIPIDRFSNLKSNNFLPYVMAALFTRKQSLDDSLLLNANGNICESTIANVFIIRDGQVLTPSLQEGCVAGVMRRYLLHCLHTISFPAQECALSINDMESADEVFLSNAVSGMRWVAQFGNKRYVKTITTRIYDSLIMNMPADVSLG